MDSTEVVLVGVDGVIWSGAGLRGEPVMEGAEGKVLGERRCGCTVSWVEGV